MNSYLPILIMVGVSLAISTAMVVGSFLLGPKKPSVAKSSPYECGMVPVGNARERFPIKFYLIAMLFIIFDVETIFLYPFAVVYRDQAYAMKVFYLTEMAVFSAILFVGYFYILGKGALDWDGSDQAKSPDSTSAEVLAPRPALRFGNEKSGDVNLDLMAHNVSVPMFGASSQEERLPGRVATVGEREE